MFFEGFLMSVGRLFVLMGPSGVGKTTLVRIPSFTTRLPRPGEVEGVDYFFVSPERFERLLKHDELLEFSTAYLASYGVGKDIVEDAIAQGKTPLLAIDRRGALQIRQRMKGVKIILIVPPNKEVLRERLLKRSSEKMETIEFRLNQAFREAEEERRDPLADAVVVNDDFERALNQIQNLLQV